MQIFDFEQQIALFNQYALTSGRAGTNFSLGYKTPSTAFQQGEVGLIIAEAGQEGAKVVTSGWNEHIHATGFPADTQLRFEMEGAGDGTVELVFEVSPEGNLRLISTNDASLELDLVEFRHADELLSSSALTLTIFADAMERSMEHDILKFTLQVNGVISKVHTFEYNSEEEVYLAEAQEALNDFTSAILDSYFDPITIRYDGWGVDGEAMDEGITMRVFRGKAYYPSGERLEVTQELLDSLKESAEYQSVVDSRGVMDPRLTPEEEHLLEKVYDSALGGSQHVLAIQRGTGIIMETTVDVLVHETREVRFISNPGALAGISQFSDPNIKVVVLTRKDDETVVARYYHTDQDLTELTESEVAIIENS